MIVRKITLGLLCIAITVSAIGQKKKGQVTNGYDCLYQTGVASAFINGLYKGITPNGEVKKHGDFGLGAPDLLDGELVMNNGKMYQTIATGETKAVPDAATTSLFLVNFFKADTVLHFTGISTKEKAFQWLDSFLTNKNGLYAIRISGTFDYIKTRAFPPMTKEPFPPLATMIDKQHFFEFQKAKGVLIGYKLPAYLDGNSIGGYHFHFLSDKQDAGGHIIDFTWNQVTVEIDELHNFIMQVPQTAEFKKMNLSENKQEDLRKVESGKN